MSPAAMAKGLARRAAEPVMPGESIKAQMRRAIERLEAGGLGNADSRVWRAWQGRAGAATYLKLLAAWTAWLEIAEAEADAAIMDELSKLEERDAELVSQAFGPELQKARTGPHPRG